MTTSTGRGSSEAPWWHLDDGETRRLGTELKRLAAWTYTLEPFNPPQDYSLRHRQEARVTTPIDITDVARQIATMWPHARMHVAPTPMGYTVVLGGAAAELTQDWWTVRRPGQSDRFWGYVECDEVVIADSLAEANAHNFHDSVRARVTAFDQRLKVRRVGDVYSITRLSRRRSLSLR